MKKIILIFILIFSFSKAFSVGHFIIEINDDFKKIFNDANVQGAVFVLAPSDSILYTNDFNWLEKGFLPASTFKIPNSIIALETGVVEDAGTIFKWDGKDRYLDVWEQDLSFAEALKFSCVPCYQEIARKIGPKRMREYLDKFEYGNMVFDSSTIDLFWLEGKSTVTPAQHIEFLKKLYESILPISERTEKIIKEMLILEEEDGYRLSGKTGWAIRNGNNTGWFVGYIEAGGNVYYFATIIIPEEKFNMKLFPKIRAEITKEALRKIGIIK